MPVVPDTRKKEELEKRLTSLKNHVLQYTTSEKKRLEAEVKWLKSIPVHGSSDSGKILKELDTILVINSLDELLGR